MMLQGLTPEYAVKRMGYLIERLLRCTAYKISGMT